MASQPSAASPNPSSFVDGGRWEPLSSAAVCHYHCLLLSATDAVLVSDLSPSLDRAPRPSFATRVLTLFCLLLVIKFNSKILFQRSVMVSTLYLPWLHLTVLPYSISPICQNHFESSSPVLQCYSRSFQL